MKTNTVQSQRTNLFRSNLPVWKFLIMFFILSSCSSTKIKYIQHGAAHKLRIAPNEVITAPPNHHYMLYLINCIDNTKGKDGIFFTSNKLRDASGQDTKEYQVQTITRLVPKGDIETLIGAVVFIIPGPIERVFSNLTYASDSGESVLLVNQTTTDSQGASFFGYTNDIIDLTQNISPVINDPCDDKGKTYH